MTLNVVAQLLEAIGVVLLLCALAVVIAGGYE